MDVAINEAIKTLWTTTQHRLPSNYVVMRADPKYGDFYTNVFAKIKGVDPLVEGRKFVETFNNNCAVTLGCEASLGSIGFINFRVNKGAASEALEIVLPELETGRVAPPKPPRLRGPPRWQPNDLNPPPSQAKFIAGGAPAGSAESEENLETSPEGQQTDIICRSEGAQLAPKRGQQPTFEYIAESFNPIGHIESPFTQKYGTPRQGLYVASSRGRIVLRKEITHLWLEGLEEYSHLWVIFVFHENTNGIPRSTVRVPKAKSKIGVLASRSPHRPNPIGLSLCEIDKVEGNIVYVKGLDIIDQTPVLDIKPYHPLDNVNMKYPGFITPVVPCPVDAGHMIRFVPLFCSNTPLAVAWKPQVVINFLNLFPGSASSKTIAKGGSRQLRDELEAITLTVENLGDTLAKVDELIRLERGSSRLKYIENATSLLSCIVETVRLDPRDEREVAGSELSQRHQLFIDKYEIVFHIEPCVPAIPNTCECVQAAEASHQAVIDSIDPL